MLRYQGTYRVIYEIDNQTGKPLEFSYVPCRVKKGSNICRFNADFLNAYITSTNITNRLIKEYPGLFSLFQSGDNEATLLFKETDIEKVATILKAYIQGKDMSPKPKRKIVISEERKQILSNRMKELHITRKNIGLNEGILM